LSFASIDGIRFNLWVIIAFFSTFFTLDLNKLAIICKVNVYDDLQLLTISNDSSFSSSDESEFINLSPALLTAFLLDFGSTQVIFSCMFYIQGEHPIYFNLSFA